MYLLFELMEKRGKQLVITAGVLGLLALYVFPQFHDNNAGFHLIARSHTVKRIMVGSIRALGRGFRNPSLDRELVLNSTTKSDQQVFWC